MERSKVALRVVVLGAFAGFLLSLYSFLHHFAFTSGSFCTINATFDCDVVNRGPYSEIFGIPVSLLGLIGYGLMGLTGILAQRAPEDRLLAKLLALFAGSGFLFALYLTGIEAFVLHTWCLICVTSQFVILAVFAATLSHLKKQRNV